MLFYRKRSTIEESVDGHITPSSVLEPPMKALKLPDGFHNQNLSSDLVDGYGAFMREVLDFNVDHAISKQLLDSELHDFILSLLQLANDKEYLNKLPTSDAKQHISKLVTFASSFFFDVFLHCRDRSNVQMWIEELKSIYSLHTSLATDFIANVLGADNSWFFEYLFC